MPNSTSIKVKAFGVAVMATLCWVGYRYYDNTVGLAKRFEETRSKYLRGELPNLPGPYVTEGVATDLKFEKIDLGIGTAVEMSEDGDILYKWYGDKPIEVPIRDLDGFERIGLDLAKPIFRLRKKDGTFKDFPSAFDVRLTPGGRVFEIVGTDSDFSILKDGKEIYSHSSKAPVSTGQKGVQYWSNQTKITDWGIFPNESSESNMLFGANDTFTFVNRSKEPYVFSAASSSELGVIGIPSYSDTKSKIFPTNSLPIITAKGTTFYPLPSELSRPVVTAGKSVVALYNSLNNPSRVFQFKDKAISVLPIVRGVVNANATSINSKGEYVLEVVRIKSNANRSVFPPHNFCVLISGGKSYDLAKILAANGIQDQALGGHLGYGPSRHIDENGDLLLNACFDDFQRVVLLRRMK